MLLLVMKLLVFWVPRFELLWRGCGIGILERRFVLLILLLCPTFELLWRYWGCIYIPEGMLELREFGLLFGSSQGFFCWLALREGIPNKERLAQRSTLLLLRILLVFMLTTYVFFGGKRMQCFLSPPSIPPNFWFSRINFWTEPCLG